jgi:hypothetical protein
MPDTCYVPHNASFQAAQLHDVVYTSTKASNSSKNGHMWSARILVPHLMQTRCHVAILLAVKVLRNSMNTVSRLFVNTVSSYLPRMFNTRKYTYHGYFPGRVPRINAYIVVVQWICEYRRLGNSWNRYILGRYSPYATDFFACSNTNYVECPRRYTTQTFGLRGSSVPLKLLVRHKTSKTEISFPF